MDKYDDGDDGNDNNNTVDPFTDFFYEQCTDHHKLTVFLV